MDWRRLRYLWPSNKRREEREMQEELASLAAMAEPRELGNLTLAAERARQTWHLTSFTGVAADIRYALRALRRESGFLAVAVLSVALGVGVNTAVFSFVDAYVLRPLPLPHPSSVLRISNSTPNARVEGISYPDFRDIRDGNRSFSGLVAFRGASLRVALDERAVPQLRDGTIASSNFFTVLDIVPPLGRAFLPEPLERSSELPSAVLGHDFWLQEFGGDRSVVGRTLKINGIPFAIVGVAPSWFPGIGTAFTRRPAVFVPLAVWDRLEGARANPLEDRGRHELRLAGRLHAGVSRSSAQAELAAIATRLEHDHPETNRERRIILRTELGLRLAEDMEMPLFSAFLMTLVALVLVVACFNVAGLLLQRAQARRREIAIRLAIGAGPVRLVRQLMTESVVVALVGGGMGLGFAHVGIRFLSRFHPAEVATLPGMRLDARVLLFSLAVTLASCLLFGLAPALHAARTDLVSALKSGPPAPGRRRRMMARNVLVVGQITATMLLLIVGGMMLEGSRRRMGAAPGFRIDHVIAVQTDPGVLGYSAAQTRRFYLDLAERARALPSVEGVTLTERVPSRPTDYRVVPEGHRAPVTQAGYDVLRVVCDDRYFATLQVPILLGRGFGAGDRDLSPRVGIVNEQFVERFWPGQAAVGRHVRLQQADGPDVEVVGVVRAPIRDDYIAPPGATLFLPYEQNQLARMTLLVAYAGDHGAMAASLRGVVHGLDAEHPVPEVRTLESYDREAVRALSTLVGWFLALGLIGLGLAVVGLYALIAYSVSRRTSEIGLRMAVGSTRAGVLRLVVRQGLMVTATGVALAALVVGLTHAALAGSFYTDAIVTMFPPNAPTYVGVPLAVLVISAIAALVPARRAASIDPMEALRQE